jgi:hypothetical protein
MQSMLELVPRTTLLSLGSIDHLGATVRRGVATVSVELGMTMVGVQLVGEIIGRAR